MENVKEKSLEKNVTFIYSVLVCALCTFFYFLFFFDNEKKRKEKTADGKTDMIMGRFGMPMATHLDGVDETGGGGGERIIHSFVFSFLVTVWWQFLFDRSSSAPHLPLQLFINAHSTADPAANVTQFCGNNHSIALLCQLAKRINVLFRHLQRHCVLASSGLVYGLCNQPDTLSFGPGSCQDCLSLTGGLVSDFLLLTLGGQHGALLLALSDVDVALSLPFGLQNLCPFAPLSADLSVHGLEHVCRWVDIADLVSEALDAPAFRGLVDGSGDVAVQVLALLEDVVQGQLANLGTHCGLRQLGNRVFCVLDAVACLVGVDHLDVEHAVHFQSDVIAGDGALRWDFNRVFLERLDVLDLVDEREEDREPRREDAVELTHALDNPGGLLGNETDDGVGWKGFLLEEGEVAGGGVGANAAAAAG